MTKLLLTNDDTIGLIYASYGSYYPQREYLTSLSCKGTNTDHIGLGTSEVNREYFKKILTDKGATEVASNNFLTNEVYPDSEYFMVASAESYWAPDQWVNSDWQIKSCRSKILPQGGYSDISRAAAKKICSDLSYFGLLFHSTKLVYESKSMGQVNQYNKDLNAWETISATDVQRTDIFCQGSKGGGTDLRFLLPALFLNKVVCF